MGTLNVVAHNLPAMYSNRQLGINTKDKGKSMEKLSSGYKINRAADDAAGLSISEKMRKRIRGLNQGTDNMEDGVSLCQIADGALAEVDDMLHRMTELSIKAANGTLSESDRQDVQKEITQLMADIDRTATTTSFNNFIHPLNGKGIDEYTIPGETVSFDNIILPEFRNGDSFMQKWPFTKDDPATTMRLRAEISGTGTALDGRSYNLIYEDGNSNKSKVMIGYVNPGEEPLTDSIQSYRVDFSNMRVDPDSVVLDEANQRLSRTFSYSDDEKQISFKIYQSVTLDAENKSYKIDTSLEDTGAGNITGYMFLQFFDTAYGGDNHGDYIEQYYKNGNRIDNTSTYGFSEGNSLITAYRLNLVGERKLAQEFIANFRRPEAHGSIPLEGIPDSISIANTEDYALPFSEYIQFDRNNQEVFMTVDSFYSNHWKTFKNYVNNKGHVDKPSLEGEDLSFTYATFGPSTITYGIRNIFSDDNLGSHNENIKLADYHVFQNRFDSVWIQSSDTQLDGMDIPCVDATTKGLGLEQLDVTTEKSATEAIDLTKTALKRVGEYRSNFGAHQNRLEHSIKNNENTAENTTAAESRIRDTDMAKEMSKFSNMNILEQAGQSMLTQSNHSRDYIMSLLQ